MKNAARLFSIPLLAFTAAAASIELRDDASLTDIAPDAVGNMNVTEAIVNATDSGIDLSALPVAASAINYIANLTAAADTPAMRKRALVNPGNGIDVHSHLVFPWYRSLVPLTGGEDTPEWDTTDTLNLMSTYKIGKVILANSAPMANVFMGDRLLTVAMARLINISTAAIKALFPKQFEFFAVVPLPNADDAIAEAKYALDTLGAVGIAVTTNHEGLYLGNAQFKPFFNYLNSRKGKTIVFIHPTSPIMKVGGKFMEANPTLYMSGISEFYFETARCLMDLTWTQTLQNFTNIQYITAHVGGAFPSILDRMIKSVPALEASSKAIYQSRIWYDSAGPTYPNQVQGLLAYGIPHSQLLFGTDFPYAPSFTYGPSINAIFNSTFLNQQDINALMTNNAKTLFGSKLDL